MLSICFVLLACAVMPSCSKHTEGVDQRVVFNGFEPLWKLYLASARGGWKNNDNGRFSNDDAPALEALLELHSFTGDLRYLDTFATVAGRLLANDDIARGTADIHRGGIVLPGWSSTRYTHDSTRTIFLMDDALILLPLVKARNQIVATGNPSGYPVSAWLDRARKEFDMVFRPGWKAISASEGYFQDPYFTTVGMHMPMNQYCIPGLLALELYKATGVKDYLDYATATAAFVKSNLRKAGDAYVWYYKQPSAASPATEYDDFSHAQLVTRFIVGMYQAGYSFTDADLQALVKTFLTQVMDGDRVYTRFGGMINESTPLPPSQVYVTNPWLTYYYCLVPFSSETAARLKVYNARKQIIYDPASDYNHIGEFVVLHYAHQLKYSL